MKKLISLSEIQEMTTRGEKVIYLDKNVLVTPAARDAAAEAGISLKQGPIPTPVPISGYSIGDSRADNGGSNAVDVSLITRLVLEVLSGMKNPSSEKFVKESDAGGLRLIRGNTVRCEPFDTGNPQAVVGLTDIVNTRESPNMGAGFMTIDKSAFDWELNYDEFDVILEGTLEVTINGRTYQGKAGDVFFIPKGSKITWSTPDRARFFYATYPANWAEQVS